MKKQRIIRRRTLRKGSPLWHVLHFGLAAGEVIVFLLGLAGVLGALLAVWILMSL